MSEWQPISTAPKDQQPVLVYGEWAGEIHGPAKDMKGAYIATYTEHTDHAGYNWSCDGGDYYASWIKPTHWMPLPAPPDDAESA